MKSTLIHSQTEPVQSVPTAAHLQNQLRARVQAQNARRKSPHPHGIEIPDVYRKRARGRAAYVVERCTAALIARPRRAARCCGSGRTDGADQLAAAASILAAPRRIRARTGGEPTGRWLAFTRFYSFAGRILIIQHFADF